MPKIFISYRRDDCAAHAGRLYDRFADRLGTDSVFIDVDAIEPGVDFGQRIASAVESCDVFIALIGDDWLDIADAEGRRRLDDPEDLVRVEIAEALTREDLRVVPVLVERATMPRADELPPDLAPLARRNAFELSDAHWRTDVDRLIDTVDQRRERGRRAPSGDARGARTWSDGRRGSQRRWSRRRLFAGLVVLLAVVALGAYMLTPEKTAVPFVEGAPDAAAAESWLRDAGLQLVRVDRRVDPESTPGTVIEQVPIAGTKVRSGSSVSIVVAEGTNTVQVPRLDRLTQVMADGRLRKLGLKLGRTTPTDAPDTWLVRSQVPGAGMAVQSGTAVRVFLRAP